MLTLLTEPIAAKVLIMSANPFVTDFLRGLVEAHGHDTEEVTDFHKALLRVRNGLVQVIFIDDTCLGPDSMDNLENVQLSTQDLRHEGVPIILLATEQRAQQLAQRPPMSLFRIVKKPVGYLQIGQAMADLIILGNGKRGKPPAQSP